MSDRPATASFAPIALADVTIVNDGTREELLAATDRIIDPLIAAGEIRVLA